jgi:hypothetical protein
MHAGTVRERMHPYRSMPLRSAAIGRIGIKLHPRLRIELAELQEDLDR